MAQSYEMDCLVTEITDAQGSSYWIKAWNMDDQELGFGIDLDQITDVMTEVPHSFTQEEFFVSRDFLVTVQMNSDLWVRITEYESGVVGEWDPEDGGPVSWEDWDNLESVEEYMDGMYEDDGLDEDDDESLLPDDWEPGDDDEEDEDFLGEGDEDDELE